jgi:hypothetical protein
MCYHNIYGNERGDDMKKISRVIFCLGIMNFSILEGMQKGSDLLNYSAISSYKFIAFPVTETPTLYLIYKSTAISFVPKGDFQLSNVKSLLDSNGFNEIRTDPVCLPSSPTEGVIAVSFPKDVFLPVEIHSAIDFFAGYSVKIPEDEKSLFFLRSLLLLGKADEALLNCVEDKLSEYKSYYKPDPYSESLKRLHKTGIYEYAKLFTETSFEDMQLVLEFSRLTKVRNSDCARDFEVFIKSLKIITEIVKENESNAALLQKFKSLYARFITK